MSGGTVSWDASRIAFDQRPGVGAPERDGPAIFSDCRTGVLSHISQRSRQSPKQGDSTHTIWPGNLDGLKVAPDTHIVIFENDHVRVLERCATFYHAQIQPIFGGKKLDVFQMTKAVNKHLQ